ncbi:response regulator [Agrococcus baldri]|nr:response regulator transcription factor [Agrococcus baldri]
MIVDDHEVVRGGLAAMLSADEALSVVATASTGGEALRLATETRPDAAVIDLRLPDMNGEELTRRLAVQSPEVAVIILSTYDSESAIRGSIAAGAIAYVTKAVGIKPLRDRLHEVRRGEHKAAADATAISRELHELGRAREGKAEGAGRATPQQARVLELAARGLTNKEVGARLFISESTVRFHVQKLKELTGSRTRTELVAKAIRNGMIAPHDDEWQTTRD